MLELPKANFSAGSHLIFFNVKRAARKATLMLTGRVIGFDQAPIMLPAAECAAHRHLALSEHDEIARLSAQLGFQRAAGHHAREPYVGLYAHPDAPPAGRVNSSLSGSSF
jgi:hypothetical protein